MMRVLPARVSRVFCLALSSALLFGACTSGGTSDEKKSPAGIAILRAFDPSKDAGKAFGSLHTLAADPAEARAAATATIDAKDNDTRYAAVYTLALLAADEKDVAILAKAFDDPLHYLRAIAAGSAVGLGEIRAIPVLIDVLDIDDPIPFSTPEVTVSSLAFEGLSVYTGQSFGWKATGDHGHRLVAQGKWKTWWQENGASLRWDPTAQRYVS